MLSSNLETPPVSDTSVRSDLLQTLQVLTKLVIESGRNKLSVSSILEVLSSIQHVVWDLEGPWVGNHNHELVNLLLGELTGSLVDFDLCLLKSYVAETSTNTLDGGQSKVGLLLSINIRVSNTNHMLKCILVSDKRLQSKGKTKENKAKQARRKKS